MLRSIHIENFRALREFRMSGLGRVNLLVGTNNCGKTTILEALHILALAGRSKPLLDALLRRGEVPDERSVGQAALAHLVPGHQFHEGPLFAIEGMNDDAHQKVAATVLTREAVSADGLKRTELQATGTAEDWLPFVLRIEWSRAAQAHAVYLRVDDGGGVINRPRRAERAEEDRAHFITTKGVSDEDLVVMLDAAVLTPTEATVLEALHCIEPTIERLATIGPRYPQHDDYGSIVTMVAGQRVPLGSLGDGIRRLLGLALGLAQAKGGILLVDEIDTGLHYTVLTKMWRLVLETAARLEVQVFATTHSRDCYEALAEVAEPDLHHVSLQRIERDKAEAVAYSTGVLRQAADHGIEVR